MINSEIIEEVSKAFEEARKIEQEETDKFWNGLSYDDKCNAFHAVMERLVQGELKDRGSYRYVLYDIFNFGPDMYVRGMNCGFMGLHNSIETKK